METLDKLKKNIFLNRPAISSNLTFCSGKSLIMKKFPHSAISQVLGQGYHAPQGDSARRVWSNGGRMINRGKLKKTLLLCHFIHHESQIKTPGD